MNSSLAFFIISIVAIVMCANVIQSWIKHKHKNKEPETDQELEDLERRARPGEQHHLCEWKQGESSDLRLGDHHREDITPIPP